MSAVALLRDAVVAIEGGDVFGAHRSACAAADVEASAPRSDALVLGCAWRFTRSLGELRAAVLVARTLRDDDDDRQLVMFEGAR